MSPVLSVVIPAYGRVEPLKYTLRSVARSLRESGRAGEIVLVDDGSPEALAGELEDFDPGWPVEIVRQDNSGSIVARMTGWRAARGKFVTFVDSDDLVHPAKFRSQLDVMENGVEEITYTDSARVVLGRDHSVESFAPLRTYRETRSAVELLVTLFPCPHSPVFRRDYLDRALSLPAVPARRIFDSCGDVWLYRNLALHPTRARKVPGHYAGIGIHDHGRFTDCWEKLGVAALGIDEAVMGACEGVAATEPLRRAIGEGAFHAFRLLPPDVPQDFEARLLRLWRESPASAGRPRGGRGFRALASCVGPIAAARWVRWWRRPRYADCKTLADKQAFQHLLGELPPLAA